MSPEQKVQYVREIFFPTIKAYIQDDLRSMLSIEKKASGACNFPIALTALSAMDYLGFLVAVKRYRTDGHDTVRRIQAFGESYFSDYSKKSLDGKWKKLSTVFRNGLSHVYFPKSGGVSRVGGLDVFFEDQGSKILDADTLAMEVIAGLDRLNEKVNEKDEYCIQIYDRQESSQT
ncbi:MAG TPA: hypothetical protein PLK06_00630 [bacterium]|nr:hypothetical protein [bacterium]